MRQYIAHACYGCGALEGTEPNGDGDPRYVCDRCAPRLAERPWLPSWVEAYLEDWRPGLAVIR